MRAEKNNPSQSYIDFWDWLRHHSHVGWALCIAAGYLVYVTTTEEV
jgi:hypothetical protein